MRGWRLRATSCSGLACWSEPGGWVPAQAQPEQEEIRAAVERLAATDQMGELFKVLAVLPRGVRVPPFD